MAELLLTCHCASRDVEALIDALRPVISAPLHVREETVHGRDFSDARTAEQVVGTLRRSAIELIVAEDAVDTALSAIASAARRSPVRWHLCPVLRRGRME